MDLGRFPPELRFCKRLLFSWGELTQQSGVFGGGRSPPNKAGCKRCGPPTRVSGFSGFYQDLGCRWPRPRRWPLRLPT